MTELLLIRDTYTAQTTIGKLYINGVFFCHTLEDTVRGHGIKVNGHTAIPAGFYQVKRSISYRFKRDMLMIYTEPNGYELKNGGISFKGIRIHGGNTHANTEGCVLVAFNKINDTTIQGTAEYSLIAKIKELGDEINLTIKNR